MHESTEAREAQAQLTARYDRAAAHYRELWAPVLRTAALSLIREVQGERVIRVIDVGAGVGSLLDDLAAAFPGASVVGVDRSSGMLALAPGRYGRAIVDARELPFAPASADRVFLFFMLFHLENPVAALAEARRVLRPGGRVAAITWAGEMESKAWQLWTECLDRHGAPPIDPAVDTRHAAVDAPEKVEAMLREAGFAESRAWKGELVCTHDPEQLIRLKTNLGPSKPRFDSLTPEQAAACLADARRRMAALAPEDFTARGGVIYAIGGR